MKLLQELLDAEFENGIDDKPEKSYKYKEEARKHADTFVADAREILNHNSKEGTIDEVEKLAMQSAKDYHEAICKAIQKELGKEDEPEIGGEPEMGM